MRQLQLRNIDYERLSIALFQFAAREVAVISEHNRDYGSACGIWCRNEIKLTI